jgi:hypothetical protein
MGSAYVQDTPRLWLRTLSSLVILKIGCQPPAECHFLRFCGPGELPLQPGGLFEFNWTKHGKCSAPKVDQAVDTRWPPVTFGIERKVTPGGMYMSVVVEFSAKPRNALRLVEA